MKNELKAPTFKPNRKRNVSVAKRLGNAVSFRVSAEGLVAGVSTKNLQEPTFRTRHYLSKSYRCQ